MEAKSTTQILDNSKKTFTYKIIFNKAFKICYWSIPLSITLIFLIVGIVLLSISTTPNSALLISGLVFMILSFVGMLSLFVFDYYRKKALHQIKDWFSIDKIVNETLINDKVIDTPFCETEMYLRDYLSYYHHDIALDREVKWTTKTYLASYKERDIFIRANYLIDYKNAKTFLINGAKWTQWYIQIPFDIEDKVIISKNELADLHLTHCEIEQMHVYAKKELNSNQIKTIGKLLKQLNSLDINYEVLLDNNNAFIFVLVAGNDLYINFENTKYDETSMKQQINHFTNILKTITN